MSIETLMSALRGLKLNGMADALEHQRLAGTTYAELSFDQRLGLLLDGEVSRRANDRLTRILKEARLRYRALPEEIEYRPGRGLDRAFLAQLLTCDWVERRHNLAATGATGTGKTWLVCALATAAARMGYTVRYHRLADLLEAMSLAHADGSILRMKFALNKVNLLVLDDFGLNPLTPQNKRDLFAILEARVGSNSTAILGQMDMHEWHGFIDDDAIADAIMDRLIHSSHRLSLKGHSMRDGTGIGNGI